VDVYWTRVPDCVAQLAGLLSDTERRRYHSYTDPLPARQFLVGRALLRLVVAERVGGTPNDIVVHLNGHRTPESHGKPTLPGTGLHMSLSHSGPHIVLAVADVAVGVDVQTVVHDVNLDRIADLVLTTGERRGLREMPQHQRHHAFTRIWTRKEAILKATGDGLCHPLTRLEVAAADAANEMVSWLRLPQLGQDTHVRDLVRHGDVPASVATVGCSTPLVREQEWTLAEATTRNPTRPVAAQGVPDLQAFGKQQHPPHGEGH